MKKTPMGENALLIFMTHYMKHNTLINYEKFIRFSLDIFLRVLYCRNRQVLLERGMA